MKLAAVLALVAASAAASSAGRCDLTGILASTWAFKMNEAEANGFWTDRLTYDETAVS